MTVFTGQPYYVIQKMARLRRQGYRVVKQHIHPDNSITVTMER
jgi:hypothetical protein